MNEEIEESCLLSEKEQKIRQKETYRHLFRLFFTIVMIAIEAYLFYRIWMAFYNPNLRVPYRFKGNYFVTFIYAILMLIFGNVYGGLKLGYYRVLNIIFSLSVTAVVANAVAYIAVIIPAATWYLSPIPAMLYLSLLEIAVIIVWSLLANRIFGKLFPPQRLLLLYGSATDDLAVKFASRKDRYDIVKRIQVPEPGLLVPEADDRAENEKEIREENKEATFAYTETLFADEAKKGTKEDAAGFAEEMEKILQQCQNYDGVVIGDISAEFRNDILKYCYSHFIRTYTLPKLTDIILESSETLHIFDSPIFLNRNHGLSVEQAFIKRASDIVMALIGLILTSPILLLTALAIKIEDHGPVFFKQERCTKGGRAFQILKFRSMIVDAEKNGAVIPATDKDPRITKVGAFIRATRIDELPQLINILKGDMSVVGPRPERVEHVRQYTEEIPEFPYRMLVKGGLTGYAQVYGKYNTTAYDKLKLDLMYIQNYSFLLDLEIILKTIQIVLTKESTEGFDAEKSKAMGEKSAKE